METGTAIAIFAGVYLFNHLSGMALTGYLRWAERKLERERIESEERQAKAMANTKMKIGLKSETA